ncbi:glycerate kinase [Streptomyces triculaminicus]|uniref:Glycerate kinase n=1 Tax=Streptomyces triculaminicus TaxID=2816232 RepID=A0A939JRC3_9ACTN|nr:glycerate kinase [Streptomyces triculaminicus]MBO0656473.1 glycerate kinase [Streptomyces triculaminicus]
MGATTVPRVGSRRLDAEVAEVRGGTVADTTRRRRVLVAPDKFKGSLTALEVARHMGAGLRRAAPGTAVTALPVADGGDGTVAAALAAGFDRRAARVTGPLGEPVDAAYALRGADGTAVVEMAEASGLRLLPDGAFAPLTATTRGTGELLLAALDAGARTIVLGVGGSATTDGGAGMLTALGARLTDARGRTLAPGGAALAALHHADLSALEARLARTSLVLAGDVDNPLTGPRGAAAVYGPQKGASPEDVAVLDAALAHYARVLDGGELAGAPGAGAAGGLGYGALAGLGAAFRPGIEVMLEVLGFREALAEADLVVTGEGSLDEQTLHGKAPVGVARASSGTPVVAVCGRLALGPAALAGAGIERAYALTDLEPDARRCMADAGPLLELTAEAIARDYLG